MHKRMMLLLLMVLLLAVGAAAAESVVVNLVDEPDAPYAFAEGAELLEVYFPMIHGADACFLRQGDQVLEVDGATYGQRDRVEACMTAAGIDHVNIAFNTHPHADHLPGMVEVAERVPVGRFVLTAAEDATYPSRKAIPRLQALNIPLEHMGDGDSFTVGAATVDVIQRNGPEFTENDTSAMLMVRYGERSLLLAADVENRAQTSYAADPPACGLKADILKYPHHGLAPVNRVFRDEIAAEACVVTNNLYEGHYAKDLQKQGTAVFSTIYGVLRLRTDGQIWVIDYLPGTLRRQPPKAV